MRLSGLFSDPPWALAKLKQAFPLAFRDAVVRYMISPDRASRRALRKARSGWGSPPVAIRLRALSGGHLWLRPGTDDPWTLREMVTYGDHWPPPDLGAPRLIVDLGANIGASMALLAHTFPGARLIGVEPDRENAEICRRNIAPWSDRCELVEAAAWTDDGTAILSGTSTSAFSVVAGGGAQGREVPTISMDTLVERYVPGQAIDYIKMDIEGAERQLLTRNTDWSSRARCLSIEVHSPYTLEQCAADLRRLGFRVSTKPAGRGPRVVGLRP